MPLDKALYQLSHHPSPSDGEFYKEFLFSSLLLDRVNRLALGGGQLEHRHTHYDCLELTIEWHYRIHSEST